MNCSNEYLTDIQLAPESRIPWEQTPGRVHEIFKKAAARRRSSVSSESADVSEKCQKAMSTSSIIEGESAEASESEGRNIGGLHAGLGLFSLLVFGHYLRSSADLYIGVENWWIVGGSVVCSAIILCLLGLCLRFFRDLSIAMEDEVSEAQASLELQEDKDDDFVIEDPLRRGLKENDPRAFNMMYQEQNHIYNDFRTEDGTWMEEEEDDKPKFEATNFGSTTGRFGSKSTLEPSLSMPGMYRGEW